MVVSMFPEARPRRLRRTPAIRRPVAETRLSPAELVLPLFVKAGLAEPRAIASLPGALQHTQDSLRKVAAEAVAAGVGGLMLFGVPQRRDPVGSGATDPDGILTWRSGMSCGGPVTPPW
jgi:porphobilinogen synthase